MDKFKGLLRLHWSWALPCLFCLNIGSLSASEGAEYSLSRTVITVNGLQTGFTQQVVKQGYNPANNEHQVRVAYTELEQVQNLVATYHNGKKEIPLKPTDFKDFSLLSSSFYDGLRAKRFVYPATITGNHFAYSYTVVGKELMFLSALPWHSEKPTDTLEYHIILPDSLSLLYRIDGDTVSNGRFYVLQNGDRYIFRFVRDQEQEYNKVPYQEAPIIRLLITPRTKFLDPTDYFAAWYHRLSLPNGVLTDNMKATVASSLGPNPTAEAVFDWVKKSVTYIAIENGLGAVQPRNVNTIFEQKQGDCKDMSNLLCQALRHAGFEAYLAMSATLSHRFDLDFPTIASANHVICVLKKGNEWVYLDATERHGTFGVPSRQIQGRNILIVYPDLGKLHYVEPVKASENIMSATYQFEPTQNSFEGTAQYSLSGFQQYDLLHYRNYHTATEFQTKANNYFSAYCQAIPHTYVACPEPAPGSNLEYSASVKTGKVVTVVGSKHYLTASFLPWPHMLPSKVDTQATYLTYMLHENRFSINLNFTEGVKLLSGPSADYSKEGFAFLFKVEQPDSQHLVITYSCLINHLQINKANINNLVALNEAIMQTFSKAITYEKL